MSGTDLTRDVRYGLRTLLRDRGFFVTAVLIIGLGIGANTAVFSLLNALLLRPLPFREPDRLVWIANTGNGGGLSSVTSRTSNLRDYRRLSRSFEYLTGYNAFFDYMSYVLTGDGEPERLTGVGVAQDFLDALGVAPLLGRNFVDEESVWNGRKAVIFTHSFWERRCGSDPAIVGKGIRLNDDVATVVGILPASFDFASIFSPGSRIDFLTPFPISDESDRQGNTLAIIGRLKTGVAVQTAQAELDLINRQLKEADPARWGLGAALTGLKDQVSGRYRRALLTLGCAVALVLLIACTNLSGLLLARAASRTKEMAVRRALGAGRGRLIRQVLTESLVIAGCGGAFGVFLAMWVVEAVSRMRAFSIPLLQAATIDWTVLLFTLIVSMSAGLLFGIAPALQISGADRFEALNDSARGSSAGKGRAWIRESLVVSEVALACILLVGAGLLLRSFAVLLDVDLGFRPERAAAWRINTSGNFPDQAGRVAFYRRLARKVETVPGVDSVGLTDTLPLGRNRSWGVAAKGVLYRDGEAPLAFPRLVDSGYLTAMRIPLIAGRDFAERDTAKSEKVMIVNEAMARKLWPGGDPVGREVLVGRREWRVVGVAADVRHSSLEEEPGLEMYLPITQHSDWDSLELVVRTKLPPESLAGSVRAALRGIDAGLPTGDFQTLEQLVDRAVSPRRFILLVLGAFALTALLLAALGIYGVVAYSVSRRAQEIGIRMALGASAGRVQWGIVSRTLALVSIGLLVGLACSFALSRTVASLLYQVSPEDPLSYSAMTMVLILAALLAGYIPARRASRIDPMSALRSE